MEVQEYSFLCSCSGCRDSFELTGTRTNGTVMLDQDPRVAGIIDDMLFDKCGGRIRLFGFDNFAEHGIKIDYPIKLKRSRGRPKKSLVC